MISYQDGTSITWLWFIHNVVIGVFLCMVDCRVLGPLKHTKKFSSICVRHLESVITPPFFEGGILYYTSRVGGMLCLLVIVKTLLLLRSRSTYVKVHNDVHLVLYNG